MSVGVASMKLSSAPGILRLVPYHALMNSQSVYFDNSRAKSKLA